MLQVRVLPGQPRLVGVVANISPCHGEEEGFESPTSRHKGGKMRKEVNPYGALLILFFAVGLVLTIAFEGFSDVSYIAGFMLAYLGIIVCDLLVGKGE